MTDYQQMPDGTWQRRGRPPVLDSADLPNVQPSVETPQPPPKPPTITAADLLAREYPPVRWLVPGILAEGATLLAGKPKIGKSWLGLDLALSVAYGGRALSQIAVDQAEALVLALEDGERRLQARLKALLDGEGAPSGLHFATLWPPSDRSGLVLLESTLDDNPAIRLVVIDTLKRWRPAERPAEAIYNRDYDALSPLADVAKQRHIAVLVVHHLRKMDAEDPLDLVSGSTGLTAACDGVLVLKRARGAADGELTVISRDADDGILALRWQAPRWILEGEAAEVRQSDERKAILELLKASGGMTPQQVADGLGKNPNTTRVLLWKMRDAGQVTTDGSKYRART